jgi:hypothetical protein
MSLIGLRDFVGGQFAVPENPVMRGQGVGSLRDFVGGSFVVPENPVMRGVGNFVPSGPMWPIPANSVITAWKGAGMAGLGCGSSKSDCGCGCGGHSSGMGTFDPIGAFTTAIADAGTALSTMSLAPITGTDWMVLGGSAAVIYLIADSLSKGGRRR